MAAVPRGLAHPGDSNRAPVGPARTAAGNIPPHGALPGRPAGGMYAESASRAVVTSRAPPPPIGHSVCQLHLWRDYKLPLTTRRARTGSPSVPRPSARARHAQLMAHIPIADCLSVGTGLSGRQVCSHPTHPHPHPHPLPHTPSHDPRCCSHVLVAHRWRLGDGERVPRAGGAVPGGTHESDGRWHRARLPTAGRCERISHGDAVRGGRVQLGRRLINQVPLAPCNAFVSRGKDYRAFTRNGGPKNT